ncbi:hypothetical protein INT45_007038 [Circinella minor]|uniref:Uncharacterized protein n=1 Tax=Circinella minor TaxID=1195481 RepID=A0A8H7VEE3_9FUNG|nr:hypothetical protein INT45_007038 [Circinella minor]
MPRGRPSATQIPDEDSIPYHDDNESEHEGELDLLDNFAPVASNGNIRWNEVAISNLLDAFWDNYHCVMDSNDEQQRKGVYNDILE